MSLFQIQKTLTQDLASFLTQQQSLANINIYSNQVVFLQTYELPAVLVYTFRNIPSQERERDTIGNHERSLELRFEMRSNISDNFDYETTADTLYTALIEFKKINKAITYIGNPTFQIGLDEKQPNEMAAILDVSLYYQGKL